MVLSTTTVVGRFVGPGWAGFAVPWQLTARRPAAIASATIRRAEVSEAAAMQSSCAAQVRGRGCVDILRPLCGCEVASSGVTRDVYRRVGIDLPVDDFTDIAGGGID